MYHAFVSKRSCITSEFSTRNTNVQISLSTSVVRFAHRCVGSHEPTSYSRPNELRTSSGSFSDTFVVRFAFFWWVRKKKRAGWEKKKFQWVAIFVPSAKWTIFYFIITEEKWIKENKTDRKVKQIKKEEEEVVGGGC
jgi:hypothetical protein